MSNSLNNMKNARSIYFTSLLSGPERALPSSARVNLDVQTYDDYLDTVIQHNLDKQMKLAAFESKKNLSKEKKRSLDEKIFKIVKKNIALYEAYKRELDHFMNFLDENDEWEVNEASHFEKLKQMASPESSAPDESFVPQKDMDQIIMNAKAKAEKIEELNRSLLMGVDLDYLLNEEACNILL